MQFNLDKSTRQASIMTIKIMSNNMFRLLMNRMGVVEIIIMPYYALEDNGFWKCCYSIVDNGVVPDLEDFTDLDAVCYYSNIPLSESCSP